MIWHNRLLKIEDGNLIFSAQHDEANFDFFTIPATPTMALAMNPGSPVESVALLENNTILINNSLILNLPPSDRDARLTVPVYRVGEHQPKETGIRLP